MRVGLVPGLARVGVALTALCGLLVAAPQAVLAARPALVFVVALAVLPAILPGSAWVSAGALVIVGEWLVATIGYDEPVTVIRVLTLAGLLYLLHSLAALAAALPLDAEVAPDAWARWLMGIVLVVAVSSALSVAVLAGFGALAGDGSHLLVTLLGLLVAAALPAVLARLARQPPGK